MMQIISQFRVTRGIRRRAALFCLAAGVASFHIPESAANGWEHTAIPLDVLISATRDPRPEIRRRAADSLGHRHEEAARIALVALVDGGEEVAGIRQAAYRALGRLGAGESVALLVDCVDSERQRPVLIECVEALGKMQTADSEKALLGLVGSDNIPAVRKVAISGLGAFQSDTVIRALSGVIADGEDNEMRIRAIAALGKTRQKQAAAPILPLLDVESGKDVLIAALRAATLIGDNSTAAASRAVFQHTTDGDIRRAALLALAASVDDGAIDYALTALYSEDWLVRYQALDVILNLGLSGEADSEAVRTLVQTALSQTRSPYQQTFDQEDPDLTLQELVQIRAELDLLHAYLRTVIAIDPRYGFALFKRASMAIEIDAASPIYLDIAEGIYRVRWQGLYGIGYTYNPDVIPVLRRALEDADFRIRAVALRSIGVYGAEQFKEAVLTARADPAPEVRLTAAQVLGRDPVFRGSNSLLALLDDSHSLVRREAALSSGYAGVSDSKPILKNLAEIDQDKGVREAANYALSLL